MRSLLSMFISLTFLFFACPSFAAVNTANVLALNTATTNVTTGAYVTLTAAAGSAVVASKLVVANASTSVVKIAYGAAGSETDFLAVGGSVTTVLVQAGVPFPLGTRFSVEAISGTASSGYITLSLIP